MGSRIEIGVEVATECIKIWVNEKKVAKHAPDSREKGKTGAFFSTFGRDAIWVSMKNMRNGCSAILQNEGVNAGTL
jgi:hypothetical protein